MRMECLNSTVKTITVTSSSPSFYSASSLHPSSAPSQHKLSSETDLIKSADRNDNVVTKMSTSRLVGDCCYSVRMDSSGSSCYDSGLGIDSIQSLSSFPSSSCYPSLRQPVRIGSPTRTVTHSDVFLDSRDASLCAQSCTGTLLKQIEEVIDMDEGTASLHPQEGSVFMATSVADEVILENSFKRLSVGSGGDERLKNVTKVCEDNGDVERQEMRPLSVCTEEQIFAQNEDGDTGLHVAIIELMLDIILWYISTVPSPDFLDIQNHDYHQTALHLAVITNQPRVVRSLVLSGASLSPRDREGNTALHIACSQGLFACVKELTSPLTNDERLFFMKNRKNNRNSEVLCNVSQHRAEMKKIMSMRNYEGETCLHLAQKSMSDCRNKIINELLVVSGADVNAEEFKSGYTILHRAVASEDVELVKFLLSQTLSLLDINKCSYNGNTALTIAQSLRRADIAQLLFKHGTSVTEAWSNSESDSSTDSDEDEDEKMDNFDHIIAVAPCPCSC